MRRVRLALGAFLATAGAGCASLGRSTFTAPTVNFQNVEVQGLGVTGGSLAIVLSVYNPNRYSLSAQQMHYQLLIDSTAVGNGILSSPFSVGARDSSLVRLPISFTYAGLGAAGRQLVNTGTVHYRVVGDITLGTPVGNFTRDFDRNGQFSSLSGASR